MGLRRRETEVYDKITSELGLRILSVLGNVGDFKQVGRYYFKTITQAAMWTIQAK